MEAEGPVEEFLGGARRGGSLGGKEVRISDTAYLQGR